MIGIFGIVYLGGILFFIGWQLVDIHKIYKNQQELSEEDRRIIKIKNDKLFTHKSNGYNYI